MRLLFDNVTKTATLSATNEDLAYPVTNLQSPYLKRLFRTDGVSTTITATFTPTVISSVFCLLTNAESCQIRWYYDGNLLDGDTAYVTHFAPILADKVQVDLGRDSGDVFLGGLGIGQPYYLPPPDSFWNDEFSDRSIRSESDAGQVNQEYIEPLATYTWRWLMNRDTARAFEAEYKTMGAGVPFFLDPEADDLPAMYGRITDAISVAKNKREYRLQLNFMEAR